MTDYEEYDAFTFFNGVWRKIGSKPTDLLTDDIKQAITLSASNESIAEELLSTFSEVKNYLISITNETDGEVEEALYDINGFSNISKNISNLDKTTINTNFINACSNVSSSIDDLITILKNSEDYSNQVSNVINLIDIVLNLDDGEIYLYNTLHEILNEYGSDIGSLFTDKANSLTVNSALANKSNINDTYLLSDIVNYVNSLNLSTNFPNTDVLTLPSDKTLWAWLFNAILTELRNKVTNDDLEDLLSVSERRYYANSKSNLPDVGDSSVLYFVLTDANSDTNQYEEYVWVNNHYELLGTGSGSVDMTNIYTKSEIDSMIGDLQDYLNS